MLETLEVRYLTCPYCNTYAQFDRCAYFRAYEICRCGHCHKMVYLQKKMESGEILDQYPKFVPQVPEAIPRLIADDYREALKAFSVNAFEATTIMSRRALQTSVLELGASHDKTLSDQLRELYDKNKISKEILEWEEEIRYCLASTEDKAIIRRKLDGLKGGKFKKRKLLKKDAGEGSNDALSPMTKDDAAKLLKFLEQYFNYVYVLPFNVSKARDGQA
jgi:HEPN domain-containing protein